jgi:hypothetical protein
VATETYYSMHDLKVLAKQTLGNCIHCVCEGKNRKLTLQEYNLHLVNDRTSLHVIGECRTHNYQYTTSCAL